MIITILRRVFIKSSYLYDGVEGLFVRQAIVYVLILVQLYIRTKMLLHDVCTRSQL